MKFTKTLVAVAIAGIAATPMIASADTTLSGTVAIMLAGNDGDDGDVRVAVDDVMVGVVSTHEMNNGLDAYGSLRIDLNSLSGADAGGGKADNVYVGIKGGFGDLRLGEVANAAEYGQVANDLHDIDGNSNGGISYTGTFGPATIGADWSPANNDDRIAVGAKFSLGGFAIGVGGATQDDTTKVSAGASFSLAGASVAVHYWVRQPDGSDVEPSAVAVKVGYGIGGVAAAVTYSQGTDIPADHETKIRLDLSYGLGGGMTVSSRINANSDHTDAATDDVVDYRLMFSKSF